jgi:hypothetical protein
VILAWDSKIEFKDGGGGPSRRGPPAGVGIMRMSVERRIFSGNFIDLFETPAALGLYASKLMVLETAVTLHAFLN